MIGLYIQKWAKAMNRQSIEKVNKISKHIHFFPQLDKAMFFLNDKN